MERTELQIDVSCPRPGVVLLRLSGVINSQTYNQLDQYLTETLLPENCRVAADLGGIHYVSSTGAGVLVNAGMTAKDHHGCFVLCSVPPKVRDVLELLHLDKAIPITDDVSAALLLLDCHAG